MDFSMVTAHEALADGLCPSDMFRVARVNERYGKHEEAAAARRVGRELARLLGLDVGGRRRKNANDNSRRQRRAA
jgi:hypothetical protein